MLNFTDKVTNALGCPYKINDRQYAILKANTVLVIISGAKSEVPKDSLAMFDIGDRRISHGEFLKCDLEVSDLCGGLPTVTHTFKDHCIFVGYVE